MHNIVSGYKVQNLYQYHYHYMQVFVQLPSQISALGTFLINNHIKHDVNNTLYLL